MKIKNLLTVSFISLMGLGALVGCNSNTKEPQVVEDVDVVAQAKINLTDEEFSKVMVKSPDVKTTPTFFKHGVSRMLMPGETDFFVNCIDGDTTHFTDAAGGYTIKVRYLGVDTKESTSEVEKWGKTTSNWAKTKLNMGAGGSAKCVIVQSLESLEGTYQGDKLLNHYSLPARDGYGRYLGLVWYTEKDPFDAAGQLKITKDDFRCMNLELVYNGFSTANDTSKLGYLGKYFIQAENIARYKKLHIFSDEGTKDENYYEGKAEVLTLKELYESETSGSGTSPYADQYTRWKVTGTITAINSGAFYIQEDYDNGEHYGIYVFTNRVYDIVSVGNKVSVIGLISVYSGNYQMYGVSYHREKLNDWEMELIEEGTAENLTPIDVTYDEFINGKYPQCYVRIQGSANCFDRQTSFGTPYAFGGTYERDTYNDLFNFYNTSNKLVAFSHHSSWSESEGATKKLLRLEIPDTVVIKDEFNFTTATSYKFLVGGEQKIYSKRGADVYEDEAAEAVKDVTKIKYLKETMILEGDSDYNAEEDAPEVRTHAAKRVDNLVGIMNYYTPVSGNANNSMWNLVMTMPLEYQFSEIA